MNIAMAHSNFSFVGGVERYVLEVTRRLAARHRVTLYTSKYVPAATYPGLSEWPITIIPEWKWATTCLKEDVIFTHNHAPNLLAYANKRVGYFAHSFMDDSATLQPDILLRRLLDRGAKRRNQRILANSSIAPTWGSAQETSSFSTSPMALRWQALPTTSSLKCWPKWACRALSA